MTGANYTGGKRNVARTRFRNSTRRVQKNHFGRRRLGILSHGLVNGTHTQEEETSAGMSSILLEHAQREISRSPAMSLHAREPGATGASAAHRTLLAGPSRTSSDASTPSSRAPSVLDSSSYASLRADMNRILEFSRTVGLCNYSTPPKQSILAQSTSSLDSKPGPPDPPRRRNRNFMSLMSELSGGQPSDSRIGHGVQGSEDSQTSRTGIPRLISLEGESSPSQGAHVSETVLVCAGSTSDAEYLEPWISQSSAHSISTPQLGQDEGPAALSEGSLCTAGPLAPSFYPLEFPSSPLPPSSPLTSTTFGSRLPLCRTSHGAETTHLNFDSIPLSSTVGGSSEDGSSSRSGSSCHITPDLGLVSPARHLTNSGLAHKVPTLLASSSKADIIQDLLTRNDPWHEIGDILSLPPIPPADATYFGTIQSLNAHSRERIISQASSSSRQVDNREYSDTPRGDGTWSGSETSCGNIAMRPDSSRHWFSHDALCRTPSPLAYLDSPEKRAVSPASPARSICSARSLHCAASFSPSLPGSGNILVPSEVPRSLFEPQASPRPPEDNIRMLWENSSAPMQSFSPFPCPLTPGRPTQPPLKSSNSPKTLISRSPGVESTPWSIITGFDLVELISKVPSTQSTETQRPKLEGPDLFEDENSLEG